MTRGRVYRSRPVQVDADADGIPRAVTGAAVESVREEWRVEDGWWTPRPLHRRYFELVLAGGRNLVVFREPAQGAEGEYPSGEAGWAGEAGCGRWFEQRA